MFFLALFHNNLSFIPLVRQGEPGLDGEPGPSGPDGAKACMKKKQKKTKSPDNFRLFTPEDAGCHRARLSSFQCSAKTDSRVILENWRARRGSALVSRTAGNGRWRADKARSSFGLSLAVVLTFCLLTEFQLSETSSALQKSMRFHRRVRKGGRQSPLLENRIRFNALV